MHAFTGCDYNPCFYRKGKSKSLKLLEKSEEYRKAFTDLGNLNSEKEWKRIFSSVEKFVCDWYCEKKCTKINKVRYEKFLLNYKVNSDTEIFKKKIKNFDGFSLPPCELELYQHFLRAKYITSIWRNAYREIPTMLKPEENGWIISEEQYEFKWFKGEQLPNSVFDILINPEELYEADKGPPSSSASDIFVNEHEIHEEESDIGTL